jgi:transposase
MRYNPSIAKWEDEMPKRICLRELTGEERQEINRIAASRTEAVRRVQRVRIIKAMADDPDLTASDAALLAGFKSNFMGVLWVKRFNAEGLAGLADRPRPGRAPVHAPAVRSALLDLALQKPSVLGYPFELWTLERLQSAFKERAGIHLSDSTIWTWLDEEGLKWKRQQSWFHEPARHDPEFVEKRGVLSRPT